MVYDIELVTRFDVHASNLPDTLEPAQMSGQHTAVQLITYLLNGHIAKRGNHCKK